ncbi:unnamed protein product [Malus baccata var. baccata]
MLSCPTSLLVHSINTGLVARSIYPVDNIYQFCLQISSRPQRGLPGRAFSAYVCNLKGLSFAVAVHDDAFMPVSILHVEAAAARASALFLRYWGTEQVQVEGDALMVISAIHNAGAAHHGHYGHLFADTRHILQSFKQWKVSFGRRDTNKVVHRLAGFSLTINHPVSWFEAPPPVISDLLLEDSTSR